MQRARNILLSAGLTALVCSQAVVAPARAWTKARVTSAAAWVDITPDHEARVTLQLALRVDGGWVRKLSLPGPGSELGLTPHGTPTFTSETGARYTPHMKIGTDGDTVLEFEREEAPERGLYTVSATYRTARPLRALAGAPTGYQRLECVLPAWDEDLEDVMIYVHVAGGGERARLAESSDSRWTVERGRDPRTGNAASIFRRTYVPRATEWRFLVDIPLDAAAASARDTRATPSAGIQKTPSREAPGLPLAPFALLFAVVAAVLAKRTLRGGAARLVSASSPLGLVVLGGVLCALRYALELDVARGAISLGNAERLSWCALILAGIFVVERSMTNAVPQRLEPRSTDGIEPGAREHSFDIR